MKESIDIEARLFELQDLQYRDFHARLIPTIAPQTIIGVRTPRLRKFAKEIAKTPQAAEFIKKLPHKYYDENNLHGFLIEEIKDYNRLIQELDLFLPYVDNWATCDLMNPKILKNHLPELLVKIQEWIYSDQTYSIRFGIETLMRFYLDDACKPEYLEMVSHVTYDDYYVKMMIAWYFATALAKQYDIAIESFRITQEQKMYLRTLKAMP
ncbi:MAG: DNA alkylation repair protein [Lachnospiraceae bacterium]